VIPWWLTPAANTLIGSLYWNSSSSIPLFGLIAYPPHCLTALHFLPQHVFQLMTNYSH